MNIRSRIGLLIAVLFVGFAFADVRVFVEESNSVAWVRYECTAGEVVRAFALNISVDKGRIIGISDFFRGPSTATAQGYGVFPASFRDHIAGGAGTNLNWDISRYTPLAATADKPEDTLPGINSPGITLEFGALWDPDVPGAVPGSSGTLCSLRISERATVSVAPNTSRGGVVSAPADLILTPVFVGAIVQPPEVTGISLVDGLLVITFAGGELETASDLAGPWESTAATGGHHSEPVGDNPKKLYRVRGF